MAPTFIGARTSCALIEHTLRASDFHFYSLNQVRMSSWSQGRIVLTDDAGYAVLLGTGQATSVSMVGSYVLASELAAHKDDLLGGIAAYENSLRAYVTRNQEIALQLNTSPEPINEGTPTDENAAQSEDGPNGGLPDFGALTLPFPLKD